MTRILILTLTVAFLVTVLCGPFLLPILHKLKFGQTVRDDGPASHLKKTGTPTMGGIFFIIGTLITVLIFGRLDRNLLAMLVIFIGYAGLGFADDFIKVALKRSLGLRALQKIFGQLILAVAFLYIADCFTGKVNLPILHTSINLGYWYGPFVIFILLAASNAVNLTDGLDGLAAGVTFIVLLAYAFIAFIVGNYSLAVFASALGGGCIGFLIFNHHPAKIFMGDTGSLALGGVVGGLAVLTHTELLLPIIGGIYVIETLSVILQVISFKSTGKRLFRMSPIHHHFELGGWSEVKVVSFFYFWTIIFTAVGVYLFLK